MYCKFSRIFQCDILDFSLLIVDLFGECVNCNKILKWTLINVIVSFTFVSSHSLQVFLIFITSCILENHKSFAGIILQNYSPPSITVNQVIDTIKEHGKKNENGKRFVPVETLKFVLLQMLENKEFDWIIIFESFQFNRICKYWRNFTAVSLRRRRVILFRVDSRPL